jgi:hypothetical protein
MGAHDRFRSLALLLGGVLGLALATPGMTFAETTAQTTFARPEDALRALVAAGRTHDQAKIAAILGPESQDVVSSGDPVADRAGAARFVAAATEKSRFETLDDGHVVAHIGKDDSPFAIPLVKEGERWRFDTAAGREELLNRRIGRNEITAIAAVRGYVEAQKEYAKRERAYAQKIVSEAGKHDGLYWDDPTGKDMSPLGPGFARASAEGYNLAQSPDEMQPYHGYYYRVLTAQGSHAPGGARSYVKDGKMTGGFALVAYPAEYGAGGIMTFVVGPQGIVFQKDLGEKTAEVAKAMTAYDADDTWSPAR